MKKTNRIYHDPKEAAATEETTGEQAAAPAEGEVASADSGGEVAADH